MTLYQKFKKLKIDFSAIELEAAGDDDKYFCTPKHNSRCAYNNQFDLYWGKCNSKSSHVV